VSAHLVLSMVNVSRRYPFTNGNEQPRTLDGYRISRNGRYSGFLPAFCSACQTVIPAGETVYFVPQNLGKGWLGGTRNVVRGYCSTCTPTKGRNVTNCECCNRPIARPFDGRLRVHSFCSERCRSDHYADLARAARTLNARDCALCGTAFLPARRDSIYCGAACKQKAYRRRGRP
jgi:hypothetical protein